MQSAPPSTPSNNQTTHIPPAININTSITAIDRMSDSLYKLSASLKGHEDDVCRLRELLTKSSLIPAGAQ
jgi:hypothetical protein